MSRRKKEPNPLIGTLPPRGYNEWHEWAEIQHKAGLRQETCGQCCLWKFPQELSGFTYCSELTDRNGSKHLHYTPICLECHTKKEHYNEESQCGCLNCKIPGFYLARVSP